MPEVAIYDEDGHLTRDGMRAMHASGHSVLWADTKGRPVLIRPGEPLPTEAAMAKGKPEQERAVRSALEAEIARLTGQLSSLSAPQPVNMGVGADQAIGSVPGPRGVHPDLVGAYPPQAGPDAAPRSPGEAPQPLPGLQLDPLITGHAYLPDETEAAPSEPAPVEPAPEPKPRKGAAKDEK